MRWSCAFLACLAVPVTEAFVGRPTRRSAVDGKQQSSVSFPYYDYSSPNSDSTTTKRCLSATSTAEEEIPASSNPAGGSGTSSETTISGEEWKIVSSLVEKASDGPTSLDQVVLEALPTLNPSLIMKLRGSIDDDERDEFKAVANSLNNILDSRLTSARDLLTQLLNAGEIRKLDALIGKAARDGKLDVAFFQVLNMNLQDAAATASSASNEGDDNDTTSNSNNNNNDPLEDETANRFQILQHVYTRCQEEVEKTIPPGVALLNKLLRTEVSSIRSNQLNHYLCPQPNIIKSPDGKEIELDGGGKILVPHTDFIDAIANAVKQIRTVEKAGGANREMAANMVEACRTVAKEARIVIGEHFGRDSDELINYEEGLQPVFRPESPESPYMKGEE